MRRNIFGRTVVNRTSKNTLGNKAMTVTFEESVKDVAYVVDAGSLSAGPLGSDRFKVIHHGNPGKLLSTVDGPPCYRSRLVGWQCGFERMFVAVHNYLDVQVTDDEAIAAATEYLDEIEWFSDGIKDPDFLV